MPRGAKTSPPGPRRSWETARRRDDGNDWVELRLAGAGVVHLAELDTSWFVGNAPGWAALRVLDARVAVLTVPEAKGLEFDAVVVVDPAAILADGPRGANDLYVALTRTTARLGVVHPGSLPAVLSRLQRRGR